MSYIKYFVLITVVILIGIILTGKLNCEFLEKNFPIILSTLFYSFGTLGFLVDVQTWGGGSKPEKISRFILIICYCIGTLFTVLNMR